MHVLLQGIDQFISSRPLFGREALEFTLKAIQSASNDVNIRIINGTIDSFDVPHINRELTELERRARTKFTMTRLRLQERKGNPQAKHPSTHLLTLKEFKTAVAAAYR